jgi:hypothetical protein
VRPEDGLLAPRTSGPSVPVPLDIELEGLDTELEAAGTRARRTLNGHRQPTRYFSIELRRQLLERFDPSSTGAGLDAELR